MAGYPAFLRQTQLPETAQIYTKTTFRSKGRKNRSTSQIQSLCNLSTFRLTNKDS